MNKSTSAGSIADGLQVVGGRSHVPIDSESPATPDTMMLGEATSGAVQKFSIELFNDLVASAIAEPLEQTEISRDWRAFVQTRLILEKEQSRFLWSLPARSVDMVQCVIASAIEGGGRLYLRKTSDSEDIEVVCEEIGLFKGALNVLICRFDGFFKNCKWFPKT